MLHLVKKIVNASLLDLEVKVFLVAAHAQDEGVLLLLGFSHKEGSVIRAIIAQHVNGFQPINPRVKPTDRGGDGQIDGP